MAFPRHSFHSSRPAHLDAVFNGTPPLPPMPTASPMLRPVKSSISSLNSNYSANEVNPPLPTSFFEPDTFDDRISVRSLRFHLSPRFRIRSILKKRTPTEVQETVEFDDTRPSTSDCRPRTNPRASLQPQLSHPSLRRRRERTDSKPTPPPSPRQTLQLQCSPCYYSVARNCKGYVLGGGHGDACENCATRGFFGAP